MASTCACPLTPSRKPRAAPPLHVSLLGRICAPELTSRTLLWRVQVLVEVTRDADAATTVLATSLRQLLELAVESSLQASQQQLCLVQTLGNLARLGAAAAGALMAGGASGCLITVLGQHGDGGVGSGEGTGDSILAVWGAALEVRHKHAHAWRCVARPHAAYLNADLNAYCMFVICCTFVVCIRTSIRIHATWYLYICDMYARMGCMVCIGVASARTGTRMPV